MCPIIIENKLLKSNYMKYVSGNRYLEWERSDILMCYVCITEHGCTVGINGGHMVIRDKDDNEEHIPKNLVEGVSFFGKSSMTAQCIQ